MPNDLRIRQIGRAKIEKDSAAGFQKITRKYTVEGPKASKVGLDGSQDGVALFREYGEPDEEFSDHYLINQSVTPGATVDKATLTREYAQIRDTWYGMQTSESNQLKKLTRKYVVLKNSNHVLSQLGTPELGYDTTPWSIHPKTGKNSPDESDCWDMLPKIVVDTEPKDVTYVDGNAAGTIPPSQQLSSNNPNTRVCFPRTVRVLSNANGEVELELTGSAPWKLGEQAFEPTEGVALLDAKQSLDVGEEFVVLADPRSTPFAIDDPTTYDPSDPYTTSIGTLDVGSTLTLPTSNVKPIKANVPSVYTQTDDADVLYSLQDATRETNFIEDLGVLENTPPTQPGQSTITVENLYWVRGSCSVDTSNPGIDLWTVSWVGPVCPYWRLASAAEKSVSTPTIVSFDHLGLKTYKTTSVSGGTAAVLTYFTVSEQLPVQSGGYQKNSGSVSLDVKIIGNDGTKATATFRQSFKNAAMYKNLAGGGQGGNTGGTGTSQPAGGSRGSTGVRMSWPTGKMVTGTGSGYEQVASYGNGGPDWIKEGHSGNSKRAWRFHWVKPVDMIAADCPCFQGEPIQLAAGHISWDSTNWNTGVTATPASFKITPIFFHNKTKIWKVEVTYS